MKDKKVLKAVLISIVLLVYLKVVLTLDDKTAIAYNFGAAGKTLGSMSLGWVKFFATILLFLIIRYLFKVKIHCKNQLWSTLLTYGWPALLLALSNMTIYGDHVVWQALLHQFKARNVLTLLGVGIASAFIVGFFEETVFRAGMMGVILENAGRYRVLLSIGISSLLFGLVHALNYFDSPFWDTTNQIIYAIGIGSLFATIYYLTQNLWIPIILHTLIDASSFIFNLYSNSADESVASGIDTVSLLVFLVFVAYSYFLLYRNQPADDRKLLF